MFYVILPHMFGKWQIFLFDFDGTLVNSEKLQHQAYLQAAKEYGIDFSPDFNGYTQLAHFSDHAVKDLICNLSKNLNWNAFYADKKRIYLQILENSTLELMEGVDALLKKLAEKDVITCVVTHSAKEQTRSFIKRLPILDTIDHWITREDYNLPKPFPDSYQKAIAKVKSDPAQRVIGFEDTVRGLEALLAVEADPILVSNTLDKRLISSLKEKASKPFIHIYSLKEFS